MSTRTILLVESQISTHNIQWCHKPTCIFVLPQLLCSTAQIHTLSYSTGMFWNATFPLIVYAVQEESIFQMYKIIFSECATRNFWLNPLNLVGKQIIYCRNPATCFLSLAKTDFFVVLHVELNTFLVMVGHSCIQFLNQVDV